MPQVLDEVQVELVEHVLELALDLVQSFGPVLVRVDHVAVREEELRGLKINSRVLVE